MGVQADVKAAGPLPMRPSFRLAASEFVRADDRNRTCNLLFTYEQAAICVRRHSCPGGQQDTGRVGERFIHPHATTILFSRGSRGRCS